MAKVRTDEIDEFAIMHDLRQAGMTDAIILIKLLKAQIRVAKAEAKKYKEMANKAIKLTNERLAGLRNEDC